LDNTLSDLQTRLTYQEDDIKQLNRALLRQQQEFEALRREVARLKELVAELAPSPVGTAADEPPPPHY
jgi:SlyX protein